MTKESDALRGAASAWRGHERMDHGGPGEDRTPDPDGCKFSVDCRCCEQQSADSQCSCWFGAAEQGFARLLHIAADWCFSGELRHKARHKHDSKSRAEGLFRYGLPLPRASSKRQSARRAVLSKPAAAEVGYTVRLAQNG